MSNSTYCDDHYEQPWWSKEMENQRKQINELTEKLDQSYNFIIDMVKDDPDKLCDVVMSNCKEWCTNNCEGFNKDCLKKFFAHYKKES